MISNILSDDGQGVRIPRSVQIKRLQRVMQSELTQAQREIVLAYYFQDMKISQIAQARGIAKSTVSRTLQRAEKVLKKYLSY